MILAYRLTCSNFSSLMSKMGIIVIIVFLILQGLKKVIYQEVPGNLSGSIKKSIVVVITVNLYIY